MFAVVDSSLNRLRSWLPNGRRAIWFWPRRTSTAQRKAVLRLIAVATEERLSLAPLLRAWAADEQGPQSGRVERLADLIERGVALPDAVEQVPGVVSDEDVLTIRFGSQAGVLSRAIRESLGQGDLYSPRLTADLRRALVYFVLMTVIGLTIFAFIQLKITPVMFKMVNEFSTSPVVPLRWTQWAGNALAGYWWLPVLLVLLAIWAAVSTRGGRFVRQSLMNRLLRPLRDWQAAEIVQRLSVATGAGRPVPASISTLARYHFDPSTRHKLLFVRNEVELGADVWESMASVQLLTQPEAAVLESANRLENRAWALAQVARAKKRRVTRRLERLSALVLPSLVILAGGLVLVQALAVLETTVEFIRGML